MAVTNEAAQRSAAEAVARWEARQRARKRKERLAGWGIALFGVVMLVLFVYRY